MEWEVIPTLLFFIIQESSSTFTVPKGVKKIDVFCVGGGGGCGPLPKTNSYNFVAWKIGGGGGGYTTTKLGANVNPGQVIPVTVGSGGIAITYNEVKNGYDKTISGGTSSVGDICSAKGGKRGNGGNGGDGGSGGGGCGAHYWYNYDHPEYYARLGNGGTDGGDGDIGRYTNTDGTSYFSSNGGKGQGTTTRYFGESTGTLYSYGGGNNPFNVNTGNGATIKGIDTYAPGNEAGYDGCSGICIIRWDDQKS